MTAFGQRFAHGVLIQSANFRLGVRCAIDYRVAVVLSGRITGRFDARGAFDRAFGKAGNKWQED